VNEYYYFKETIVASCEELMAQIEILESLETDERDISEILTELIIRLQILRRQS